MSTDTGDTQTTYAELTPLRQAIVDEFARERVEGLGRTQNEIAQDAAEGRPFDPPAQPTVSNTKRLYGHLIDERERKLREANVGVGGLDDSLSVKRDGPQYIQDRPVKTALSRLKPGEAVPVDGTVKVTLNLSAEHAYELASGRVPGPVRRYVFNEYIGRFGGGGRA